MEALVTVLGVGVVVVGYIIMAYNSIIGSKNQVKRSWSDVLVHVQKKLKIIPELEKQVSKYESFERETLQNLVNLRTQATKLTSEVDQSVVEKLERDFTKAMQGLKVSVEAYPDLKTSQVYQSLMKEIVEQQNDISAGITIYNRNVESFNNKLQQFPSAVVNAWFNKEAPLNSFTTSEGVQESVGFTPNFK